MCPFLLTGLNYTYSMSTWQEITTQFDLLWHRNGIAPITSCRIWKLFNYRIDTSLDYCIFYDTFTLLRSVLIKLRANDRWSTTQKFSSISFIFLHHYWCTWEVYWGTALSMLLYTKYVATILMKFIHTTTAWTPIYTAYCAG